MLQFSCQAHSTDDLNAQSGRLLNERVYNVESVEDTVNVNEAGKTVRVAEDGPRLIPV